MFIQFSLTQQTLVKHWNFCGEVVCAIWRFFIFYSLVILFYFEIFFQTQIRRTLCINICRPIEEINVVYLFISFFIWFTPQCITIANIFFCFLFLFISMLYNFYIFLFCPNLKNQTYGLIICMFF